MTTGNPALLEARRVAKRYGSVVALDAADLTVRPGEVHALLGANGAGKSTLVKVLAGVVSSGGGDLRLHGDPLRPGRPAEAVRAGVGTVFQDPAFIPDLTIANSLHLARVDRRKLREWLSRLQLTDVDLDTPVREVALPVLRLLDLARVLAADPHLLVLDEITAALPGDQVELVFSVMAELRDRGSAVLFITHRLREVLRVCDQATVLRDGRTVATLRPADGDEHELVAPMLGDAGGVAEAPGTGQAEVPGTGQAEVPDQRSQRPERPQRRNDARAALEAHDLIDPGGHLRGASLAVRPGEIVGVVALEGQGQERLFDVLSGQRPHSGGQLRVHDAPVRPRSPYDMIRRGVVLVPADRLHALLPQQTLRANLASALYNRVSRWFSLARDEPARVDGAIGRLAIDTRAQRQVRRLSGGNQQKVAVGRWLAAGFRTLLCFDPTRGIDVRTKEQLYGLLRELAADGAAILYYTSELTEVPMVCDRVLVIYGGRVVHERDARDADEETLLNAAHGLREEAAT